MTPTAQLLELKLGRDLAGYLAESRYAGKSWRAISIDILLTHGLDVSPERLRTWHNELTNAA